MSGSTFRAIELDILKIAAVALPLGHFLPILLPQSAPLLLKQLPYNYVAGILLVSTAFLVHKLFIYPTFQSPLRHLPVAPVRISALRPATPSTNISRIGTEASCSLNRLEARRR